MTKVPETTFPEATNFPEARIFGTTLRALPNDDLLDPSGLPLVPLLITVALGLGFAAQGFINQQLQGDRGLGAFLKDGSGYAKSSFRPLTDGDRAASNDPLPWLKLPKLDFVEVAGEKTEEEELLARLEELRQAMQDAYKENKIEEAGALKIQLERLMRENGIQYNADQ